jgi:gas vesicle protein
MIKLGGNMIMKKLVTGVVIGSMLGAAAGVYASAMMCPEEMGKKAKKMFRTGKRSMRKYARGIGII